MSVRSFVRVLVGGRAAFAEEVGGALVALSGAPWDEPRREAELPSTTPRLPPVAPSKILCVGRNYAAHAKELGHEVPKEPLLFFKPPSAIVAHGEPIVLARLSERVDHEGELGVVLGRLARDVREEDAMAHVFGLLAVNDVTARDLQKKDGQWARAKGMDTFCPVGPAITTGVDPAALEVVCKVDDEIRQRGNTRDFIFPIPRLIAYVSSFMTLLPGDLLVTGTPEGVGPLRAGERVRVEITGLPALESPVAPAP